jgi:putative PIN family toxin of toxin-antitoxin system
VTERVVFDCMIFLQAAINPDGPAFACFRLVDEGRLALCLSAEVLAEACDVLNRPRLRRKFPPLTPEWVETFLRNATAKALVLSEVPCIFTLERDPKDERYVNLALATKARFLVSRDNDLLDLMRDERFRQRFPEVMILDPAALLRACAAGQPPPSGPPAERGGE